MATISAKMYTDQDRVMRVEWLGMTEADEGAAVRTAQYPDRTVSVTGDFGGTGTVVIQGSNDGTNWFTLTDHAGLPVSFSAAGMKLVAECPLLMRPNPSDGTNMDIDVIIVGAPRC